VRTQRQRVVRPNCSTLSPRPFRTALFRYRREQPERGLSMGATARDADPIFHVPWYRARDDKNHFWQFVFRPGDRQFTMPVQQSSPSE
jgi:hypothetical protein